MNWRYQPKPTKPSQAKAQGARQDTQQGTARQRYPSGTEDRALYSIDTAMQGISVQGIQDRTKEPLAISIHLYDRLHRLINSQCPLKRHLPTLLLLFPVTASTCRSTNFTQKKKSFKKKTSRTIQINSKQFTKLDRYHTEVNDSKNKGTLQAGPVTLHHQKDAPTGQAFPSSAPAGADLDSRQAAQVPSGGQPTGRLQGAYRRHTGSLQGISGLGWADRHNAPTPMLRCQSTNSSKKGTCASLLQGTLFCPALIPFLFQTLAILLLSLCNKGSFFHPSTHISPFMAGSEPKHEANPRNFCLILSYCTNRVNDCPVIAEPPITLHSHKHLSLVHTIKLIMSCAQHVIANNPSALHSEAKTNGT